MANIALWVCFIGQGIELIERIAERDISEAMFHSSILILMWLWRKEIKEVFSNMGNDIVERYKAKKFQRKLNKEL